MKAIRLIAILMVVWAWSVPAKPLRFDYKSRVGVAFLDGQGKLCLLIANPNLRPTTTVTLIFPSRPQLTARATILEKSIQNCSSDRLAEDVSFYLLELLEQDKSVGIDPAHSLAIAAISSPRVVRRNGTVSADLDGDGRREFFRRCPSGEGLHFTIWAGPPLQSKRLWHYYYYLGYDTVPTCKGKDYN
jgi:hypothetical protein